MALVHTHELREDGSFELEEISGIELREPDEQGQDLGGWVYLFDFSKQWETNVHDAAVRLGTKGGIASGKSRRK